MIETVREWLTGVIAVTLMVSIAQSLMPSEGVRKAGSFTGGLILMIALLGPLFRMDYQLPEWNLRDYETSIAQRKAELYEQGNRELADNVSAQIRELIIAHAAQMDIQTNAAVRVKTDNGIPVPYAAEMDCVRVAALETWIATELGIPPENQTWRETEPENLIPENQPDSMPDNQSDFTPDNPPDSTP